MNHRPWSLIAVNMALLLRWIGIADPTIARPSTCRWVKTLKLEYFPTDKLLDFNCNICFVPNAPISDRNWAMVFRESGKSRLIREKYLACSLRVWLCSEARLFSRLTPHGRFSTPPAIDLNLTGSRQDTPSTSRHCLPRRSSPNVVFVERWNNSPGEKRTHENGEEYGVS